MALSSFPYPIPNLMISIIPFKEDPKALTQASWLPFPWLTIPIASSSLYAIASTFDPLKFLLTCLALTLFTFLRAGSLKPTLIDELAENEAGSEDRDTHDDASLLGETMDESETHDGSISDEESLIELDPNKSWRECYHSMDPFLRQPLMDLFAEIYEEENMIEIDIAIGSIKKGRDWSSI